MTSLVEGFGCMSQFLSVRYEDLVLELKGMVGGVGSILELVGILESIGGRVGLLFDDYEFHETMICIL